MVILQKIQYYFVEWIEISFGGPHGLVASEPRQEEGALERSGFRWSEVLDLQLETDALTVFVANDFEGDIPWCWGKVVVGAIEPNGGKGFLATTHPKANVLFLEYIGALRGGNAVRVENRRRISHATGLQQGQLLKVRLFESRHLNEGIEFQSWNEVVRFEALSRRFYKMPTELVKVAALDAEAGRHVMAAKGAQPLGAVTQGFHERESIDTAPTPMAFTVFIEADDQCRAVILAAEAGSNDADNPMMPTLPSYDQGRVAGGVKIFCEGGRCCGQDMLFQFLSFAITVVEILSQFDRLLCILREKKLEGGLCRVDAASGIEPRAEAKSNLGGRDW